MMESFESLIEELDESISTEIKDAFSETGFEAVFISPVMSGRFQSSWAIAIDGDTVPNSEVNRAMDFDSEAQEFSILTSKSIELYNDALNDEDNENYAEFVRFDYTGSAANQLLEEIEQQVYTRL